MAESTPRRRRGRGGRPSKGDRHLFQSRVPQDLANQIMDAADDRGLTFSDYIALVLAKEHAYRLPDFYYAQIRDDSLQEAIPMQNAS